MYDRRVVRGNTFAALVIPVSKLALITNSHSISDMQPDPSQLRTQQAKKRPRRTQQGARNVKTVGQNQFGDMGMTHDGAQPADSQMYDPSTGQPYTDGQPFEMQIK